MPGLIALAGGAEFLLGMAEVDRYLLDWASGAQARVAVLPTAAARERPELAAAHGVRHFQGLGAQAEAVMIVDRATANDAALVAPLRAASLIYLAGGSPMHLLESLENSLAWQAVREARERGAVLAGSSAGAMVLCQAMRVGGSLSPGEQSLWRKGLGLVAGAAVIPHFKGVSSERWAQLQAESPAGLALLGIDEQTAMVGEGRDWVVLGQGEVVVWRDGVESRCFSGQRFELPA